MDTVQIHATEQQWKSLVEKLAEGLHGQIKEHCKYRREVLETALEKVMLSAGASLNFIKFPLSLLESSKEVQADLIVAGHLILHFDELEGNEEYWRKLLTADEGKNPDIGINCLLSILYNDLHDNLMKVVDEVAKRNPLLYAVFYTSMLEVLDAYKLGSVAFKLLGSISSNIKSFKVKHEFGSEGLKKVVYNLEETCEDAFNDFLVIFH
jgi:hypothetical protein